MLPHSMSLIRIINALHTDTYDVGEAVSLDINGLDQGRLLEGTNGSGSRLSQGLGSSVETEGRGGCGEDGEEGESGDLHGCRYWFMNKNMRQDRNIEKTGSLLIIEHW
mmetsp:Transcript_6336/g.14596  ORF Transcript_6336/g.14596 Transcript_6336/m.14596 type:complete len:108 (+) Transcript_6336:337-660(+)